MAYLGEDLVGDGEGAVDVGFRVREGREAGLVLQQQKKKIGNGYGSDGDMIL